MVSSSANAPGAERPRLNRVDLVAARERLADDVAAEEDRAAEHEHPHRVAPKPVCRDASLPASQSSTAWRAKRHSSPKRRPGRSPASTRARTASGGSRRSSTSSSKVSTSGRADDRLGDADGGRQLRGEQRADERLLRRPQPRDGLVDLGDLGGGQPHEQRAHLHAAKLSAPIAC